MQSAFITGLGVISPVGDTPTGFWNNLLKGVPKIGPITRFDPKPHPIKIAGQVDNDCIRNELDARTIRSTSHATQLALIAGIRACQTARVAHGEDFGIAIGTAMGGWNQGEQQFAVLNERGANRINPFLVNSSGCHGPGIALSSRLSAHGCQVSFSTGCVSSTQAVAFGAQQVSNEGARAYITGGTESPLSPTVLAALARTNELSLREDSRCASRPFDLRHEGMVLSEGACILVLETEESAKTRNVDALAVVIGSASNCDACGPYDFDETGETGARAVRGLLEKCGVSPDEIDYVCAHANSSPAFDRKEAVVLRRAFGEYAAKIPVSSIKGVLGHPFGASGAFQTAAAALAMKHSVIPPTANLENPDPDCDLNLVMGEPLKKDIRHALITSYGYGGVNSFLLLRNPHL